MAHSKPKFSVSFHDHSDSPFTLRLCFAVAKSLLRLVRLVRQVLVLPFDRWETQVQRGAVSCQGCVASTRRGWAGVHPCSLTHRSGLLFLRSAASFITLLPGSPKLSGQMLNKPQDMSWYGPGISKHFCKEQAVNISGSAGGRFGACCNYSALPLELENCLRQYVNKWAWVCSTKIVFTRTCGNQIWLLHGLFFYQTLI